VITGIHLRGVSVEDCVAPGRAVAEALLGDGHAYLTCRPNKVPEARADPTRSVVLRPLIDPSADGFDMLRGQYGHPLGHVDGVVGFVLNQ
jgi:hypothetical protein